MSTKDFTVDIDSKLHPKIQVAIGILESQQMVKPYYVNIVKQLQSLDMQTQLSFINVLIKILLTI